MAELKKSAVREGRNSFNLILQQRESVSQSLPNLYAESFKSEEVDRSNVESENQGHTLPR